MNYYDIRRSYELEHAKLSRLPNWVATSIGFKEVGDELTDEPSIKFYVEKKSSTHDANLSFPKEIIVYSKVGVRLGSIATDVCEYGEPAISFGVRTGHVLRAIDGDIGVCAISLRIGPKSYVVTCAHVSCDVKFQIPMPLNVIDSNTGQPFFLGNTVKFRHQSADGNVRADFSIIEVDPATSVEAGKILGSSMTIENEDVGSITHNDTADYWYQVGRERLNCSRPEKTLVGLVKVDNHIFRYRDFVTLRMRDGDRARPGHSGAAICKTVNAKVKACGILFGGDPTNGRFVHAFNFRPILTFLEHHFGRPD